MTFCVTYYAQPELLRICLDSIQRHHPEAKIVVSQQIGDAPVELPAGVDLIKHDMPAWTFAGVVKCFMGYVMQKGYDGLCVFIEHDCFLLRPLDHLVRQMANYEMVGVEEMLDYNGKVFRSAPGMANQNFFMLDVYEFTTKYGRDAVFVRREGLRCRNIEPAYGISQSVQTLYFLPATSSGYGCGTFYGDENAGRYINYVHHLWYGSYKRRSLQGEDIEFDHQEREAQRLIADYDAGKWESQ